MGEILQKLATLEGKIVVTPMGLNGWIPKDLTHCALCSPTTCFIHNMWSDLGVDRTHIQLIHPDLWSPHYLTLGVPGKAKPPTLMRCGVLHNSSGIKPRLQSQASREEFVPPCTCTGRSWATKFGFLNWKLRCSFECFRLTLSFIRWP